jgi:hypothetical protein
MNAIHYLNTVHNLNNIHIPNGVQSWEGYHDTKESGMDTDCETDTFNPQGCDHIAETRINS